MDKGLLVSYLLEIIISIACILVSIPIWQSLDLSEFETIANKYDHYGIFVDDTTAMQNN